MTWTPQQRRKGRREYARLYQHDGGTKVVAVSIPENVERRESHEPCFACGVADGCRHRPWMLSR